MNRVVRFATLIVFTPPLLVLLLLITGTSAVFTFFDWTITGGEDNRPAKTEPTQLEFDFDEEN